MLIVELHLNVCDSMGANIVNTVIYLIINI